MKRCFLAACALSIGSLGLIAPRASADGTSKTYQVPFAGVAVSACLLDAAVVVPGTLENSSTDKLTTLTPGTVSYFCNAPTTASVSTPVQKDLLLAGETISGTFDSEITKVTRAGLDLNLTAAQDVELSLAAGANIVSVGMTATDDDGVIQAGAYSFDVPLTITCL